MSQPFVAEIKMFGFNFAPQGYAFCNGQVLPINQNTALFSLLGTQYGGNGQSTFALPNLQGSTALGAGQGPGLTDRYVGETGGAATVTLTQTQLPSHGHGVSVATSADGVADRGNATGNILAKSGDSTFATGAANTTMSTASTTVTGSGTPHNNMQPYLALKFCIALQGIFPARN